MASVAHRMQDPVQLAYDGLLSRIRAFNPFFDEDRLEKAYQLGRKAHDGQMRASGEPYFTHPIAVAHLLADMHFDLDTIITALLHDTVEDCDITLEQLEQLLGETIAQLVNGVTKLTRFELQSIDSKQAENFRKLVMATSADLRVLLVKLADRTHNMETIDGFSRQDKKERIARETLDIYAPLAERLGITHFQNQLEESAFKVLYPEMQQSIFNRLEFLANENENIIQRITQDLMTLIQNNRLDCQVSGRRKTPYSIWRKMQSKKIAMEQLSDVMAFRVIVPRIEDCYTALGIIHQHYPMVMGRMKDYISAPKRNGYRSLHTGVIGPLNRRIEIQLRTPDMHDEAERGVAAHWDYKNPSDAVIGEHTGWVQELTSLIDLNAGADEFLEHTKMEMFADQVFCFTPRGDLINLPRGATAVDFAYNVHSKIGDTCVGVLINDKNRQLATELQNGDQVKILTDPEARPRAEWEEFIVTGRAKAAIRRYIRQERQHEFSRIGQALLEKEFRFRNTSFDIELLDSILTAFEVQRAEELFEKIADGDVHPRLVFERLYPAQATQEAALEDKPPSDAEPNTGPLPEPVLNITGLADGVAVHMAKCCHPILGDRIVGIFTTGKGLTVHSRGCSSLAKFTEMPELWVDVNWGQVAHKQMSGRIRAVIFNEPGALAALCSVIGQQAGNITFIQLSERSGDFFTFTLDVAVRDKAHLQSIITMLRSNKYIESADRYSFDR
ncbi:MAG: RelA/SpoT family protein [Candidatus Puniceispirillaceae bacterium]